MNESLEFRCWWPGVREMRHFNSASIVEVNDNCAICLPSVEGTIFMGKSICMQYLQINDCDDKKYFDGDIGQFENGDRFYIAKANHLEYHVNWVGEAKCEDQARDFYRLSWALKIGNIHQNPELLKIDECFDCTCETPKDLQEWVEGTGFCCPSCVMKRN